MLDANRAESVNHFLSSDFSQRTETSNPLMTDLLFGAFRLLPAPPAWNKDTTSNSASVSWLPAPQSPDGLRPVCIQSLFILCTSLIAVMETSWFFSPNSSSWAKRGMYRHGSGGDRKGFSLSSVDLKEGLPSVCYLLSACSHSAIHSKSGAFVPLGAPAKRVYVLGPVCLSSTFKRN